MVPFLLFWPDLICVVLIIRAGVLCAYAANQNLSSQLKSMRRLVKSNLRDLHTFANQTPAVSDTTITNIHYYTVIDTVDRWMDGWLN